MEHSKAFDASEVRLSETTDEPCPEWSTVSLFHAARTLLAHEPDADETAVSGRGASFLAVVGELTRRGIDASSLVRYGFMPEIAGSLVALVTASRLLPDSADVFSGIEVDAWARLLDMPTRTTDGVSSPDADIHETAALLAESFPRIVSWVLSAPLEDLATLKPPTNLNLLKEPPSSPTEELFIQYRWMVDRFSATFIQQWTTDSLHSEYRWANGHQAAPCPEELMHDRPVDHNDLKAEIARRAAVPGTGISLGIDPQLRLVHKMSDHARVLVRQGKVAEAATLLDFAHCQKPHDASTSNNLGFCLIPTDPRQALFHLEEAASSRYTPAAINIYNQMCCLIALNQPRRALRIAGEYWADQLEESVIPGSLWRPAESGGWQLIAADDARAEIAELAEDIAQLEGQSDVARRWADRRSALVKAEGPSESAS